MCKRVRKFALFAPSILWLCSGAVVAGDGAIRYRDRLAADIPADGSPLHVPWARHHALLAGSAGPPVPQYVRTPDADRVLAPGAAP